MDSKKKEKKIVLSVVGVLAVLGLVVGAYFLGAASNSGVSNTQATEASSSSSDEEALIDKWDNHARETTVADMIKKVQQAGYDYKVTDVYIDINSDGTQDAQKPLPQDLYQTVHVNQVLKSYSEDNTIYIYPLDEDNQLREGVVAKNAKASKSSQKSSSTASSKTENNSDGSFYVTGKKTISESDAGTYKATAVTGDNILLYVMNDDSSDKLANVKFTQNMAVNPDQDSKDMGFVTEATISVDAGNVVQVGGGTVKFEKIQ